MSMSKIGVNLLWLVPGRVGGSETYLTRLLSGLAERSTEFDYTLFALPQFAAAYPELSKSFKSAYAPVRGRFKALRVAGEATWLANEARRRNINLVHHAGGTMPAVRVGRPVLTIHDLQYLYYPEYFTRTKLNFLKVMVPRSAEAARVVLTPSEYTRRSVIERLNIDPSIVITVPHGISPRDPKGDPEEVRRRFGLTERFFIYPAITYPHKNHLVLVEAFGRLMKVHPDVELVLTGAKGSMEARLTAEVKELGIDNRVRRLGYIPSADLDTLYQAATGLVFASRFEGFGAPVLEAMARGCPVIASDATALPEVVTDAGILVSPDNAEEWFQAMCSLLEDDELRTRLSKAGLSRATEFTWDRSAEILEEAYRHALETTL